MRVKLYSFGRFHLYYIYRKARDVLPKNKLVFFIYGYLTTFATSEITCDVMSLDIRLFDIHVLEALSGSSQNIKKTLLKCRKSKLECTQGRLMPIASFTKHRRGFLIDACRFLDGHETGDYLIFLFDNHRKSFFW